MVVGTLFVLSHAAEPANSGGWTQWRGPLRDGVSAEKGLLQKWPEGGPKLLWRAEGLGEGYSSLSFAGDKIFTLGKRKNTEHVLALSAEDGKILWEKPVGQTYSSGNGCTPTLDGDRLYAVAQKGDVVCLAQKDGTELWRLNYIQNFGGALPSWGFTESPLVDGDRVILTPGGPEATLIAVNKLTGNVVWKSAVPKFGSRGGDSKGGYSSVVVSEAGGVRQYVQLTGRGCVGIRADDGKFLWGYDRVANGVANIPTPIVHENLVFCTSGYGTGSALLELSKDADGVKAREVYFLEGPVMQNHHGGLVRVGDYIYGGHGHNQGFPICIEMKTGKVVWRKDRGPGRRSAAVVYADNQVYFRYEDGVVAIIGATPKGYELNGSFSAPDNHPPCWSHPVVLNGKLYLRDQGTLLVYDVAAKK